jgi:Fungal specific transcription factor domain
VTIVQPVPPTVNTITPIPHTNFDDLRLLHYYTVDLAHTLSLPGAIGRTWSQDVPALAFEDDNHAYLVHALLAAAAAHKVLKSPADEATRTRGQEHYVQSLAILKELDFESSESHAAASLAAVMLLTWYEVPHPPKIPLIAVVVFVL